MKVNMSQILRNLDGSNARLAGADGQEGKDATLGLICSIALTAPHEDDKKTQKPEDAVHRWKLSLACYGEGEVDLKPEDITLIRARLPKIFPVLLSGQACDMLS